MKRKPDTRYFCYITAILWALSISLSIFVPARANRRRRK